MLPIEVAAELPPSVLTKSQKRKLGPVEYTEDGQRYRITATVRFDDECNNGHNTFSITGQVDVLRHGRWADCMGGCIHDQIAKHFPELAPLIKWHLVSTDGPMHYVANVTYHASDKDCWGGSKGEVRTFRYDVEVNGGRVFDIPAGKDAYKLPDKGAAEQIAARILGTIVPVPWLYHEGKARDFAAARSIAVWPDATDEQLSLPKPGLTLLLYERLPALMREFKAAVEAFGFTY